MQGAECRSVGQLSARGLPHSERDGRRRCDAAPSFPHIDNAYVIPDDGARRDEAVLSVLQCYAEHCSALAVAKLGCVFEYCVGTRAGVVARLLSCCPELTVGTYEPLGAPVELPRGLPTKKKASDL